MAIPTTTAPIYKQDFTLRPVKVFKNYSLSGSEFTTTGSGYSLVEGYYTNVKTPIDSPKADNDPRNSIDNSFKHTIWNSIDHLYYRHPYDAGKTFEHYNQRYTYKFLNLTGSMISMPYMDYGDRIKKGSIEIVNAGLGVTLRDDSSGNIYDVDLEDNIISFPRQNVVGYWGFNDEFRNFKYGYGSIESGDLKYKSFKNSLNQISHVNDIEYTSGLTISGSNTGIAAKFNGTSSFIMTPHHDDFNFDKSEFFTVSFWMYIDQQPTSSETWFLLGKNGVEFKQQYGLFSKTLDSGEVVQTKYNSGSYVNSITDIFPYQVTMTSQSLTVQRSNGVVSSSVSTMTPIPTGSWNHICFTRYIDGEKNLPSIALFLNGVYKNSDHEHVSMQPLNNNCLMFGSKTLDGQQAFKGYLDEIRIVNKTFYDHTIWTPSNPSSEIYSSSFYTNLSNLDYAYNTSVVGNVFYRQGRVILSPHLDKYKAMFSGSWYMNYSGVHTIYEYEVLCRVRKGDFNLTMNPSARKSPKSDLLIDEFTSSLLQPYATTIGMYDDQGELMAVGKMSQPIQMREDVDINFLVKWDV